MGTMVTDNNNNNNKTMDLRQCNRVTMVNMAGLVRRELSAVCLVHRLRIRAATEARWAAMVGRLFTKVIMVMAIMAIMAITGVTGIMGTMGTMDTIKNLVGKRLRGHVYEL